MRVLFTLSILIFSSSLFAQTNCIPGANGIAVTDDFPGCVMCVNVLQGRNSNFTADANPQTQCGTVENSLWFSFYADNTGSMAATFLTSNCSNNSGLDLSLFDKDLNHLGCFTGAAPGSISASNLRPGELHHVMIDGQNGDVCDYTFILNSGGDRLDVPGLPGVVMADPGINICVGATATFSIDPVANTSEYVWEIPNTAALVSGGGLGDTFVEVTATSQGGGAVTVTPRNSCFTGNTTFSQLLITGSLPGPTITCTTLPDGIDLSWNALPDADSYDVIINGSFVSNTTATSFLVDNLTMGAFITARIEAQGECTFQPAQMTCNWNTNSIAENHISRQLTVVPNPTSGIINIQTDLRIEQVEIFDMTGRFLQREIKPSFNLNNQDSGIYFMKITTADGVGLKRVLVN